MAKHPDDARFMDLTGQVFTRLTVIEYVGKIHGPRGGRYWKCKCSCPLGKITISGGGALRSGDTKSCGCLGRENCINAHVKHGCNRKGKTTPEYAIWAGMKRRCENKNVAAYPRYGGRGIKVCNRWRNSFPAFLKDMGPRPSPEHSLDRHPRKDGPYSPNNTRWATLIEQANNKENNVVIPFNGKSMTLRGWSDETGILYGTLSSRKTYGWSVERMLTTPVYHKYRNSKCHASSPIF